VDVENVGPYIFDDVLPEISTRNDQCLPQGQFAWPVGAENPVRAV
jgi:hypothetical protein